jgi:hypothetical protein
MLRDFSTIYFKQQILNEILPGTFYIPGFIAATVNTLNKSNSR